jgi:hypothetical protein
MFVPHGGSVIVKRPSIPVVALTIGEPEIAAPHRLHVSPVGNGITVDPGTYTNAFGSGSGLPHIAVLSWPGAVTIPVIVVCTPGAHVDGTPASLPALLPQTDGTPPPPQICGAVHVPQLAINPPQPSGHGPQLIPAGHAVAGTHGCGTLHTFGMPPRPHIWPEGQVPVPHVIVPPQPFM